MLRILLIFLSCLATTVQALPVFPGAEGFGIETPGGRGGIVCKVTNLDDSGKGSLRDCVEMDQPRIVVFTTGGTIKLKTNLTISHPFISIYGQTAPGDGIMITGEASIQREPFTIATHDVVIQHLRFRAGAADELSCCRDALSIKGAEGKTDGQRTYNVVLDHCSFSWGTSALLSTLYDAHDLTISHSIIGPSLYNGSNKEEPASRGTLLGSAGAHSISFHHNLLVHSQERNPRIEMAKGVVDVVNNLVYNWGLNGAEITSTNGDMQVNMVQNLYITGENSAQGVAELSARNNGKKTKLYLEENLSIRDPDQPEPLPVGLDFTGWKKDSDWEQSERFSAPALTTYKAQVLVSKVLSDVGATLPKPDSVDNQAIKDVTQHTGVIPHCVDAKDRVWIMNCDKNAGGWPHYNQGTPANDRDDDGIPDAWETAHDMNPNKADSTKDYNANGYLNIEEWVFSLTPANNSTDKELYVKHAS